MKKFLMVILAALMLLGVCACGSKTVDLDTQALADDLQKNLTFDAPLQATSAEELGYYFEIPQDTEICGYMSNGATAEEIVVACCADASAAQTLKDNISAYLQDQTAEMEKYMPEEVARLDGALLECSGNCVVLCVASDTQAASAIVDNYVVEG